MRKVAIRILLIIALLVSSFLIYRKVDINKNVSRISIIKSQVVSYLNTRGGYNENMYDLKVNYYFQRKLMGYNPYVIEVKFKDEGNVIYYYNYWSGQISQCSIAPLLGKEDKNFKHQENH